MKKIAANEFKELYQTSEITVLDVREKGEFQDGHIPTAKNYPLSTLEQEYTTLNPEQKYYVICQGGMRSARACQFLEEKGFDVTNVEGGMNQWQA